MSRWGGRAAQRLTAACLSLKGRACVLALPGCTGVATTAHHVVPRSLGGPDTLANLVPACLPCNQRQGNRVDVSGRPPERADVREWFEAPCQVEPSTIRTVEVVESGAAPRVKSSVHTADTRAGAGIFQRPPESRDRPPSPSSPAPSKTAPGPGPIPPQGIGKTGIEP